MDTMTTSEVRAPGWARALPWIATPERAEHLAVVRIVVFGVLCLTTAGYMGAGSVAELRRITQLPDVLVVPPTGLGWVPGWVLDPTAVTVGAVALVVAAGAAAVGWRFRFSGWAAALLAIWIVGVSQAYGKVNHSHHLVWFALILAAAPCTDAYKAGAERRASTPSSRYGVPLRSMWLLVGVLYLSAGLQKAATGLEWALSDNLRNRLWARDILFGQELWMPPEWALPLLALGVLAFELLFLVAILPRRTRPWAVLAGVAFHVGTMATMGIGFVTLLATYVMFLPAFTDRPEGEVEQVSAVQRWTSGVVVAGVLLAGLSGTVNGWPFAAYPSFAGVHGEQVSRLAVSVDGGPEMPVGDLLDWIPGGRGEFVATHVLGSEDPEKLEALNDVISESAPWTDGHEVTFWWMVYRLPDGEVVRQVELPIR